MFVFVGTAVYCPPEKINRKCYRQRQATIWSLGTLLFMMVCGESPFNSMEEVLNSENLVKDRLLEKISDGELK